MVYSVRRIQSRAKTKAYPCLKCGAKTVTFVFWASLYVAAMKMTIFKRNNNNNTPVKEWAVVPDNYTKWLVNGPILGEDEEAGAINNDWQEPDNETLNELEMRSGTVRRVCRATSLHRQLVNNKEFFIDHAHSLVWCNIFKAASSSWLYNFNILGGYDKKFLARTRYNPLTLARKKFPRPSVEELEDAVNTPGVISLLVVREPFVRLLSAYRDKLENISPPYYRKLARAIVAKHREDAIKVLGPIKSFGPTFYEFVAYLTSEQPSLVFDEHWAPYYKFCSPCAINFTVIAKVETLAKDSSYVVQQLGLGHVLGRRVGNRRLRLRTVMNKSRDGKNTSALLRHYYGQLDEEMLDKLLRIYGTDFEMFSYDSSIYYRYVRK